MSMLSILASAMCNRPYSTARPVGGYVRDHVCSFCFNCSGISVAWLERESRLAARPPPQYYPLLQSILDTVTPPPTWLARSSEWEQFQQTLQTLAVSSVPSASRHVLAAPEPEPEPEPGRAPWRASCVQTSDIGSAGTSLLGELPLLQPKRASDAHDDSVCNSIGTAVDHTRPLSSLAVVEPVSTGHQRQQKLSTRTRVEVSAPPLGTLLTDLPSASQVHVPIELPGGLAK